MALIAVLELNRKMKLIENLKIVRNSPKYSVLSFQTSLIISCE